MQTTRDHIQWEKDNPLHLDKPLAKKWKAYDRVIVKFGNDFYLEGWVTALSGGDFATSIRNPSPFGDKISFFIEPKRGLDFHFTGNKEFWLQDIGIGKTRKEADESYRKHDWFKRSKSKIQNDRFWAWIHEKEER